jgi:halimadienyl-diphosphate synthase
MKYVEEARKLVQNLDQSMGPSPYDMAWLARLQDNNGAPKWPQLIDWLLENQNADGSWGAEIEYFHDRIICTLTATIALSANGHTSEAQEALERGENYLWQYLHLLPRDPFELVGFELILPTLLIEARSLNLDVPTHACGYEEIQTAKLRLIPLEMLYSPEISTVHSLEFLGRDGDVQRLGAAIGASGSIGNSPATTAYYLSLGGHDERSFDYLETLLKNMGYATMLYPFRIFELTWVLNNLAFSGLPITEFAGEGVWELLQDELRESGVGLDPTFGIPDGDITAVCSRLLMDAGHEVSPLILHQFENKKSRLFRTYEYERNISIGTNIHAFEALHEMPDYPDRRYVQEQIVVTLLNNRKYNLYWIDKWHTSPFYATSHALVGLLREGPYILSTCRHTVDWLLHTQREDGSWGFFEQGTAEETAYVLTALLHYHQREPLPSDVLHRGAEYLRNAHDGAESTFPALWIDKCLYVPHNIVRSAELAALILYSSIF